MRLVCLLLAAAALSACAGSAPVVVAPPPPPPPPRPAERPPAPRPPPPPPVAAPVEPEAPAAAPRGTVQTRAYYDEADVTEWVLTNGATVVFKPLPNGGQVRETGFAASLDGQPCEQQVAALAPSGNLSPLFGTSLGSRAVYVVVGDARPGEVEQAAARLLRLPLGSGPCAARGFLRAVYSAPAPAGSDAALAVLAEVLRLRGSGLVADHAPSTGAFILSGDISPTDLAALRPTDAEMSAARAAAARRDESVDFWTDMLADLYRTDGALRPTRDPSFVARFRARVARVTARDVADLAARFAASPR